MLLSPPQRRQGHGMPMPDNLKTDRTDTPRKASSKNQRPASRADVNKQRAAVGGKGPPGNHPLFKLKDIHLPIVSHSL